MQAHGPDDLAGDHPLDGERVAVLHQGVEALPALRPDVAIVAPPDQLDAVAAVVVRHQQRHDARGAHVARALEDAVADVFRPGQPPLCRVQLEESRRAASVRYIRPSVRTDAGQKRRLRPGEETGEPGVVEGQRFAGPLPRLWRPPRGVLPRHGGLRPKADEAVGSASCGVLRKW